MINSKGFLVSGISVPLDSDESEALDIASSELKCAGVNPAQIHLSVFKRSIDARKKNNIRLVYSVAAVSDESIVLKKNYGGKYTISPLSSEKIEINNGTKVSQYRPLIVGMGPAGLFCALLLAENGYAPIIIDRGDSIKQRIKTNEIFVREGKLDTESNIQFGAGGAGTFSDGKLLTRIGDKYISYILERFCDFGAPDDIKTSAKPHIGTDLLVDIVDNILTHIEKLGGTVIYRCRMDNIEDNSDGCVKVSTTQGDILASCAVLAIGHSAKDTYRMLMSKDYIVEPKNFSVGVRIEHHQSEIDKSLYGDFAGHPAIGKGEYHLSDTTSGRGVYTFCMCPGGQVVAATSDEGQVVVNGMSNRLRDGENANSAVLVTVRTNDYGATPEAAMSFQNEIEKTAFMAGGENYYAPIQTVGDFLEGKSGTKPSVVFPSYRDGKVRCADMRKIFPSFVSEELARGLGSFEKKLSGFANPTAVLSGVETRTSSPVRILRNEFRTAIGHDTIYPCGEGAGYAGGITSAAVDGIKTALSIMEKFAPYNK